jgi:hypothetical protein
MSMGGPARRRSFEGLKWEATAKTYGLLKILLAPSLKGRSGVVVTPTPNPHMGMLSAILLLLVLAVVGVLIAMGVVVARIASRQHSMTIADRQLRRKQKELERATRTSRHRIQNVASTVTGVQGTLMGVQDGVRRLDQRSSDYAGGIGRTLVRVDARSALSSTAPSPSEKPPTAAAAAAAAGGKDGVTKEGFVSYSSQSPSTSASADASSTSDPQWTYVTEADGKKLLSGGMVANNLVAKRGMQVMQDGGCVALGSGGADGKSAGKVCGGPASLDVQAPPGGSTTLRGAGGVRMFSENGRSGHAVGVDLFVPPMGLSSSSSSSSSVTGGAASWYKLASVRIANVATFRVSGVVTHGGAAHEIDALISTVETRDAVRAAIDQRSPTPDASGGDDVTLWSVFGLAVVHEASTSSSAETVHLYLKAAPRAASGLSVALTLTAVGDLPDPKQAQPSFMAGAAAPLGIAFNGAVGASLDASLTGKVGATLDVFSSPQTKVTRTGAGGALFVQGGAVVRGQGLSIGASSSSSTSSGSGAPSAGYQPPEGVAVVSRRLKVGHDDDSGFLPSAVLSAAQASAPDAVGASFKSRDGVWSHFPWSNGRTYVRAGPPTGSGVHIGDMGATEVQVAQSWFSRADARGDTFIRAGGGDRTVRIGDDAKAPGGVVLGSAAGAPTLVQGAMDVRGSVTTHQVRTTDVVVQPAGASIGKSSRILLSSSGPQDGSPNTLSVGMTGSGRFGGNYALFETTKSGVAGTADMVFKTNGKEVMRIDNQNNVIVRGSLKICDVQGQNCRTL